MRSAAKVHKFAVAIEADLRPGLRELRHEVGLHEVAVFSKLLQRLLARLVLAHKLLVPRDHFGHLLLDGCQIVRRKRLLAIEVVEESRIRRRPMAQLRLRKQLQHRRRQHVRSRVAHHLQRLGIVLLDQLELRIRVQRRRQVYQPRRRRILSRIHRSLRLALCRSLRLRVASHRGEPGHNGGRSQARRNSVGDIQRRRARRYFAYASVGQVYGDILRAHDGCRVLTESAMCKPRTVLFVKDITPQSGTIAEPPA